MFKLFVFLCVIYSVCAWEYTCTGGNDFDTYDVHGCFTRIDNRMDSSNSKNNIACWMTRKNNNCRNPDDGEFDKAAGHVNYWCGDKGGHRQRGVCWPDCHNWEIEYIAE